MAKVGDKNIGVNMMMAKSLVSIVIPMLVSDATASGTELSTARISCVHRAIILAIGVSSSHLQDTSVFALVDGFLRTHRKVLPKTESTNEALIFLDALRLP